jgi:hypothetical protein
MNQPWRGEGRGYPLSRRDFVRRGAGTAAGVGALVWAAPALRTVRLGQTPGSEPPPTNPVNPNVAGTTEPSTRPSTTTTTRPGPGPASVPTTNAPPGTLAPGSEGPLPLTGTDALRLAAIGGTAVVSGRILMRARVAAGLDGLPRD